MKLFNKLKKIKKRKDFIKMTASILFLIAAALIMGISAKLEPDDSMRLWCQLMAGICTAAALVCAFGSDGAEGLKKAVNACKELIRNFAGKVLHAVASLFGMRLGGGRGGAALIKDYRDTSCKVKRNVVWQKKAQKRYKDMNNRERIRYFYGKLVSKQIKKGFPFKYSYTANEVGKKLMESEKISPTSNVLFTEYNEARYNIRADITDEDVEKIKKIYKNPRI